MFQTMTQIGSDYDIDAKTVGKFLYTLKIRDANHPKQKGFPFEQAITHGIAKAFEGRGGELYYRYNIQPIKEEFEKLVAALPEQPSSATDTAPKPTEDDTVESKLQQMLSLINSVLKSGKTDQLYRLKADIADIYALLPTKS
ncbi:MAG: hypothetical protein MUP09_08215 [Thiovulaceae bacterium]|nr:hypothetical protein [Sulfurimonadaceae bacterium]